LWRLSFANLNGRLDNGRAQHDYGEGDDYPEISVFLLHDRVLELEVEERVERLGEHDHQGRGESWSYRNGFSPGDTLTPVMSLSGRDSEKGSQNHDDNIAPGIQLCRHQDRAHVRIP